MYGPYGHHWFDGWFMMIFMVFFWVLLLIGIAVLVLWLELRLPERDLACGSSAD